MKRKTKQIFGLLLVLTMALGMMPTKVLAAKTITTLTLTGVTKPVAGKYPSIDGVSLGEQIKIQEGTRWLMWDGKEYTNEFDDTKPFEKGKKYALIIVAEAADGYELSQDLKVIFNGKELPYSDNTLPYYRSDIFVCANILAVGIVPEDMPSPQYDNTEPDGFASTASTIDANTSNKAKQPMTIKAKMVKVNYKKLKKKKMVVKAITVKKAQGTVSYAKVKKGSSSKLSINKRTGKITVKKGTKKGTYKIVVKVTAKGNAKYLKGSKTLKVKVKVK